MRWVGSGNCGLGVTLYSSPTFLTRPSIFYIRQIVCAFGKCGKCEMRAGILTYSQFSLWETDLVPFPNLWWVGMGSGAGIAGWEWHSSWAGMGGWSELKSNPARLQHSVINVISSLYTVLWVVCKLQEYKSLSAYQWAGLNLAHFYYFENRSTAWHKYAGHWIGTA